MISLAAARPSPRLTLWTSSRTLQPAPFEQPKTLLAYGPEGYPPFVNSLKSYLEKTEGFDFSENELLILSGGQQCADITAKMFVNEGDTIA